MTQIYQKHNDGWWYANQRPPISAVTTQLGYIGDSLTYQNGSGCLANGGSGQDVLNSLTSKTFATNTVVDGLIGRSIVDAGPTPLTQDVINSWRSDGIDPQSWVMALGSNNVGATDQQWTTYIGTALDAVAAGSKAAYTVYWIGITFSPTYNDDRSTRFTSVMESVAAARSDKITMVPIDYDSLIHNGRDESDIWLASDTSGRHMTTDGYALRNQIIADAIYEEASSG